MIARERLEKAVEVVRFHIDDEVADFFKNKIISLFSFNTNKQYNHSAYDDCLRIREEVCIYYNVSPIDVCSDDRHEVVVLARAMISYMCRAHTVASFKLIAKVINKDHSSVIYHARKISDQLSLYEDISRAANILELTIKTKKHD